MAVRPRGATGLGELGALVGAPRPASFAGVLAAPQPVEGSDGRLRPRPRGQRRAELPLDLSVVDFG